MELKINPKSKHTIHIPDDKRCDIALVIRPSEFGEYIPFAEISLSAYVREKGLIPVVLDTNPWIKTHATEFINVTDEKFELYFQHVKDILVKLNPRFIGIGSYTSDYEFVMTFARRIKRFVKSKIVVGGVQATNLPDDFIFEGSPVDFAVIGEGEITLEELLKLDELTPEKLNTVKGLCYLDPVTKTPVKTERRGLIRDISILPMPAYQDIDMEFYSKPRKRISTFVYYSVFPIYSGRGCPFMCKFCATNSVWGERLVRTLPVDRILDEIKMLVEEYKVDCIHMIDDTFTVDRDRVMEFCSKVKPLNITWTAQTRVNCIDEDIIKTMKDAGCVQLTFGVESGSQRMLNLMRKGTTTEQAEKIFDLCHKYGMAAFANMMFNLPEETEEDVRLSYEHYKRIKPDDFGVGLTVAYPGTRIYEDYFKDKIKKEEYNLFGRAREYGTGRFKLCAHNLDPQELLVDFRMNLNYQYLIPRFLRVLADKKYVSMVLKSKHRNEYIKRILNDTPTALVRSGGMLVYTMFKKMPESVRKPYIKLATNVGRVLGN